MATNLATATAPDVLDDAINASTAGHPVSADAQGSDILDNTINDSLAGRPVTSTAAPVTPPSDDTIWGGVKAAGQDIYGAAKNLAGHAIEAAIPGGPVVQAVTEGPAVAKTIWSQLPPVQLADSVRQILPLVDTYEKSRAGGASISDAIHAVNETAKQHTSNIINIKPAVDAFRANPTRETARALTDAAALAASMFVGGEAAAPEEAAATEAEAVGTPSWLQRMNPFRAKAAASTTSKIEPAVAAQTAKAGLAPGEAGVTSAEAAAKTAQAAADAQAATQANVDQTLQNIATKHATANGIPVPAAGTATRDILTANGDALVDAGKANYKILDKFTDGQFTNAQQELKNAQLELRSKAGMTDVDTGDLEANVTRAQWNVDQLFDNAVKNGMPKETADLARNQFKTGQATLDAANDVRMANKVGGPAGTRATNLNTLENRWTARYDAGRLQQAFGEQGAKDALLQVHAAREAAETFQAMPPTESQALRELIANHTETGRFGATTDWGAVRKEFSALPDRAARFTNVPKVEKFINRQNLYQNAWTGVKLAGVAAAAHGLGIDKFILHLMLGS